MRKHVLEMRGSVVEGIADCTEYCVCGTYSYYNPKLEFNSIVFNSVIQSLYYGPTARAVTPGGLVSIYGMQVNQATAYKKIVRLVK